MCPGWGSAGESFYSFYVTECLAGFVVILYLEFCIRRILHSMDSVNHLKWSWKFEMNGVMQHFLFKAVRPSKDILIEPSTFQ